MDGLGGSALLALAIVGLWLAIAGALLVLALRRMREANSVIAAASSMAALLDVAPSRPLLVRTDGSIEADERLLRELGISGRARTLSDLFGADQGLLDDDLDSLRRAIDGAALSGSAVVQQVRTAGSNRVFEVRGAPAPATETTFPTSCAVKLPPSTVSRVEPAPMAPPCITRVSPTAPPAFTL